MNRKAVEKFIQNCFRFFGLRISRIDKRQVSDADKLKWLRDFQIKTIIDIGASKGSFSAEFHGIFPDAHIYAFEPLLDCFALVQKRMLGVERFHAFNIALGDSSGSSMMHRSSYSGSSSLREMGSLHKNLFPVTAGQREVGVVVDTLDHALHGHSLQEPILVKIDVQGFEDKVIAGGVGILSRTSIVLVETSFYELYKGQPMFDGVYALLKNLGFEYHGSWAPELKSPIDGRLLQQDSVFVRRTDV
jgi:FkbM family methyltransferase